MGKGAGKGQYYSSIFHCRMIEIIEMCYRRNVFLGFALKGHFLLLIRKSVRSTLCSRIGNMPNCYGKVFVISICYLPKVML